MRLHCNCGEDTVQHCNMLAASFLCRPTAAAGQGWNWGWGCDCRKSLSAAVNQPSSSNHTWVAWIWNLSCTLRRCQSVGWLWRCTLCAQLCGVDVAHQRRVKWHLSYAFCQRAIMCNQQEAAYHKLICWNPLSLRGLSDLTSGTHGFNKAEQGREINTWPSKGSHEIKCQLSWRQTHRQTFHKFASKIETSVSLYMYVCVLYKWKKSKF